MDYRTQFLTENPDKFIIIGNRFYSQCGTSKYNATWYGNWSELELYNFADNSTGHYGGRIDNLEENKNGTKTGTICVYYD